LEICENRQEWVSGLGQLLPVPDDSGNGRFARKRSFRREKTDIPAPKNGLQL